MEFDLDPSAVNDNGLLIRGEGTWNREVSYWFFSGDYGNGGVHPRLVVGYEGLVVGHEVP